MSYHNNIRHRNLHNEDCPRGYHRDHIGRPVRNSSGSSINGPSRLSRKGADGFRLGIGKRRSR